MKHNIKLLLLVLSFALVFGCSPDFWYGFAQGLDSHNRTRHGVIGYENATRQTVCVAYKTQYGWSHGYKVTGNVIKGSELNRRTGTYNYNSFSTYVVVFWDKGEASILELDYYFGGISAYGNSAKDQYGREWEVSTSSLCY